MGKQGTVRRALRVVLPGFTGLGEGVVSAVAGYIAFFSGLVVPAVLVVLGGAVENPGTRCGKT
ncbi:hypothetical protein DN069_28490 [Streptacidiphilus pinicola]|uniref:Uncharacterized protein n=1 Tax=Streptacidiphilus pinicola TaxID=2219663 RepID=A0A2X0IWW9_9ACTN|nr:hypothetical protein DN069_28490 [Streptacidiphilus pinicola]